MDAAVLMELEASRLASIKMRMGRVSSIGHSRCAVIAVLRGHMRQMVGSVLRRVVLSDVANFQISARMMVQVWLERVCGVVLAHVR